MAGLPDSAGFRADSRTSSRSPACRSCGIGPMAFEAFVRQDRPDIAVEIDGAGPRQPRQANREAREHDTRGGTQHGAIP